MTASLPDSQTSTLPATPPSSNDAVKEGGAFIWSDFILQSPPKQNTEETQKEIEVEVEEEKEEQEDVPASAPVKSIDWRTPTFAPRISITQRQKSSVKDREDSSDEDEQHIGWPSASRNWRTPMQHLHKEERRGQTTDHHVAFAHDDTELTRLEDTDGSEMDEDDEDLDDFEMEDYLHYRLKTGLSHLDERLGQQFMHAAQDDERFDSNQGGLMSGGLMEISGTPGSGKTTLLMQVAIKERLNSLQKSTTLDETEQALSGEEGSPDCGRQVVIIDTEGSISAKRMAQMTKTLIEELSESCDEQQWNRMSSKDVLFRHTLAGIHIIRCTTLSELLATFEMLMPSLGGSSLLSDDNDQDEDRARKCKEIDEMMQKKRLPDRTSLIVVDSLSHFYRAPTTNDKQERSKRQHAFMRARSFAARAHYCGIKLIVSTQMSSYFVDMHGEKSNVIKADNIGFLRPTLRDWIEESIAENAWHVQLYGAELGSSRKVARITSRPSSLRNHDLYGEEYWSTQLPYVIDTQDGIMRCI
jgi:RecA/RadA recombinase